MSVCVCGLMSFGLFGEQAFTMSGGYLEKKNAVFKFPVGMYVK